MSVWTAIWQGILQGVTEFLPVSSSGHLVLFQHFTGSSGEGSLFFNLMLHLGTLAAVIAAYYEELWMLVCELGATIKEIFTGRFRPKAQTSGRKMLYMLIIATLMMVLVIPLRKVVGNVTGDADIVVEGICFLITSMLLFVACGVRRGRAGIGKMRARHAIAIGIMQDIATFPGISRSGSTIAAGMILGFDRELAVKFSFLLGIPAIIGGAVFEIGDAAEQGIEVQFWPLFLGMLAAAAVGYLCIRLVRWLLLSNKFRIFAWYTLVLGIVVVIIGVVEHVSGTPIGAGAGASQAVSDVVSAATSAISGG